MKKVNLILLFFFISNIITSCMLLPVEEQPLPPPAILLIQKEQYQLVAVARGDLFVEVIVSAQKIPAREEMLSFSVGNIPIKDIYAQVGDFVRKGDILAELDNNDLVKRLEEANHSMSLLELRYRHADETYLFNSKFFDVSQKAHERAMAEIIARMRVLQLDIDELNNQIKERTLLAAIDGRVSFVRDIPRGGSPNPDVALLAIRDEDAYVFIATGNNTQYFTIGQTVQMSVSSSDYFDITVADPYDIGVNEPDENAVYFSLTDISAEHIGARSASVRLVLDERKDVLYLPNRAVNNVDGERFVFRLNEENIRELVPVITGMESSNGFVEIISGINEGDLIIL